MPATKEYPVRTKPHSAPPQAGLSRCSQHALRGGLYRCRQTRVWAFFPSKDSACSAFYFEKVAYSCAEISHILAPRPH